MLKGIENLSQPAEGEPFTEAHQAEIGRLLDSINLEDLERLEEQVVGFGRGQELFEKLADNYTCSREKKGDINPKGGLFKKDKMRERVRVPRFWVGEKNQNQNVGTRKPKFSVGGGLNQPPAEAVD